MSRRTSKVFSVAAVLFCLGVAAVCGVTTIRTISGRYDLRSQTFAYYQQGKTVTMARSALLTAEKSGSRLSMNAWHRDPVSVAALMTEDLVPDAKNGEAIQETTYTFNRQNAMTRSADGWSADYKVLERRGNKATVQLALNDKPLYRITLERPFLMGWWYVTAVTSLTVKP